MIQTGRGQQLKDGLQLSVGDQVNYFTIKGVRQKKNSKNVSYTAYQAECVCGTKLTAPLWELKERKLSCGCQTGEIISRVVTKRNRTQGGYTLLYPTEYKSYSAMIRRCTDKKDVHWENYGGRGIKVAKRWVKGENGLTGFQCFIEDMGRKPFSKYSLDRINGDEGYSKDNCRWVDKVAQANNIRTNIAKRLVGGTLSLSDACQRLNIPITTAKKFIKSGGSLKDVKSLPLSILGLDPGLRNFAICHVKEGDVQFASYLIHTIDELKGASLQKKVNDYMMEFRGILDYTEPDVVVVERFMARRFSAKIIELVALMIGVLIVLCAERDIRLDIISSSQWKTPFKRLGSLESLYATGKEKYGLEPHVIDAMCMARYAMSHNVYDEADKNWIKRNLPKCIDPAMEEG